MRLAGYHKRTVGVSSAQARRFKDHTELYCDILVRSTTYSALLMTGTLTITIPSIPMDSIDIVNKTLCLYYKGTQAWK